MEDTKVIEIIENTYNLIQKIYSFKTKSEFTTFFEKEKDNIFNKIHEFYYEFYPASSLYLYRYSQDKTQSDISLKFQYICKWIISKSELFESIDSSYIPNAIIDNINEKEKFHIFKLMNNKNQSDFYAELEHLHFREEMEEIIKNKKESNISNSEKNYLKSHNDYYKSFFSNSMNLFEKNYFNMPEELLNEFLETLNNTPYFDKLLYENHDKLKFNDSNLIYQYVSFVLRMKSIFSPDKLENDKIIQGVFYGKIKSSEIINLIFSNKDTKEIEISKKKKIGNPFDPIEVFSNLLRKEGKDTKHFYLNISNHLKSVGMSDTNINKILIEMLQNDESKKPLQFLADLNIKCNDDFNSFITTNENGLKPYLNTGSLLFDILKKAEFDVMRGRRIIIPFDYAITNIEHLSKASIENLQVLIEEGYYNEKETELLKTKIKECGRYINMPEIKYNEATEIVRKNIDEGVPIDRDTFKSCIRSIITTNLKEKDVDFGKGVYFGEDEEANGFNATTETFKAIWINENLIDQFINSPSNIEDKYTVFITMFHEMQHSVQFKNMQNGKLDYLTYNFMKESLIRNADSNYYNSNYYKIFEEEDARQYGIVDAMKFLKTIGVKNFNEIYEPYKLNLDRELNKYNINNDSRKNTPFRDNSKIELNDYLGKLIRSNPKILESYGGLLKIEFNNDGSVKPINEILEEYNGIESEDDKNKLFSIYYGIINKAAHKVAKKDFSPEFHKQLNNFYERKRALISPVDLRYYYYKLDPAVNKVFLRMLSKEINGDIPSFQSRKNEIDGKIPEKNGEISNERD